MSLDFGRHLALGCGRRALWLGLASGLGRVSDLGAAARRQGAHVASGAAAWIEQLPELRVRVHDLGVVVAQLFAFFRGNLANAPNDAWPQRFLGAHTRLLCGLVHSCGLLCRRLRLLFFCRVFICCWLRLHVHGLRLDFNEIVLKRLLLTVWQCKGWSIVRLSTYALLIVSFSHSRFFFFGLSKLD